MASKPTFTAKKMILFSLAAAGLLEAASVGLAWGFKSINADELERARLEAVEKARTRGFQSVPAEALPAPAPKPKP